MTADDNHTVTDDDRDRVRTLQAWVRQRLSTESLSSYMVLACDLEQRGDLVVKVLRVLPGKHPKGLNRSQKESLKGPIGTFRAL